MADSAEHPPPTRHTPPERCRQFQQAATSRRRSRAEAEKSEPSCQPARWDKSAFSAGIYGDPSLPVKLARCNTGSGNTRGKMPTVPREDGSCPKTCASCGVSCNLAMPKLKSDTADNSRGWRTTTAKSQQPRKILPVPHQQSASNAHDGSNHSPKPQQQPALQNTSPAIEAWPYENATGREHWKNGACKLCSVGGV